MRLQWVKVCVGHARPLSGLIYWGLTWSYFQDISAHLFTQQFVRLELVGVCVLRTQKMSHKHSVTLDSLPCWVMYCKVRWCDSLSCTDSPYTAESLSTSCFLTANVAVIISVHVFSNLKIELVCLWLHFSDILWHLTLFCFACRSQTCMWLHRDPKLLCWCYYTPFIRQ